MTKEQELGLSIRIMTNSIAIQSLMVLVSAAVGLDDSLVSKAKESLEIGMAELKRLSRELDECNGVGNSKIPLTV